MNWEIVHALFYTNNLGNVYNVNMTTGEDLLNASRLQLAEFNGATIYADDHLSLKWFEILPTTDYLPGIYNIGDFYTREYDVTQGKIRQIPYLTTRIWK